MKCEYIVVYENCSYEFDIGHCTIKVKITAGIFSIYHNTNCQVLYLNFGFGRKLWLSVYSFL